MSEMDENKVWTDEDIGEEVEITIEGIRYFDTVIEMWSYFCSLHYVTCYACGKREYQNNA